MTVYIHALREEGDVFRPVEVFVGNGVSIHALREEGDRFYRLHGG